MNATSPVTHSYVSLPDVIRGSGDLQCSIPAKPGLLFDLFDSVEIFLELGWG